MPPAHLRKGRGGMVGEVGLTMYRETIECLCWKYRGFDDEKICMMKPQGGSRRWQGEWIPGGRSPNIPGAIAASRLYPKTKIPSTPPGWVEPCHVNHTPYWNNMTSKGSADRRGELEGCCRSQKKRSRKAGFGIIWHNSHYPPVDSGGVCLWVEHNQAIALSKAIFCMY